jgi:hypothetical protein
MLISGFNLAAADYRQSRREVKLAAGVMVALALVLLGQIAAWVAIRRAYTIRDVVDAVRLGQIRTLVAVRPEGRDVGERLLEMEREFRRHEEAVRSVRAGVPADAIKRYEAKVTVYNQILEASTFSWTGLLVELERSVPPGVTLSEIHPDLATGQVILRGVARSFEELGLLLRALEGRTPFRDVYLLRQSDRKNQAGGPEALEFAVNLVYQGRGQGRGQ